MRFLLSVKFYAFTTAISLQEFGKKVKGKMKELCGNLKKFQRYAVVGKYMKREKFGVS